MSAKKKILIIVESPTKAVTISKFLPPDYRVESSYGHVRDLPRSRFGIDLEHNFEPTYIVPVKARKRVTELKKIAIRSQAIILASDEDREGEAIAWHIDQILHAPLKKNETNDPIEGIPVSRIVFHEITPEAIQQAIKNPRTIDKHQVDAQQARRILDRIVGYKLSPFLWKKIVKGLSAGRVQSVALRLIVDRENEIRAFKPEEYWTVDVDLKTDRGALFSAALQRQNGTVLEKFAIKNEQDAKAMESALEKASYTIKTIQRTEVRKNPLPPFTTSTLQQESSRRLHYSAKKTMMFAQALYEKGFITYMRTDSLNLSKESVSKAGEWLKNKLGPQYALPEPRIFKTKSKGAQEAHEAIRPTTTLEPENLPMEDAAAKKLYKLIWQRFMSSQMPPAIFEATQVDIEAITNNQQPTTNFGLRTNGNVMKFDGFLKIYPSSIEDKILPKLDEGENATAQKVSPAQHFTEPPPRFTEARLIKTLEEFGIGRPSTYVPIISVIQTRNYVKREQGRFIPTEIGEMVNKLLTEHFPEIVDINFTAQMEATLDEIAEGREEWHDVLRAFYDPFARNLEKKYAEVGKEVEDEKTDVICDCKGKNSSPVSKCVHEGDCGKPMVIKFGRFGKFLACSGFPDCKNAKPLNKPEPKLIGMKCPKCLASPDPAKRDNPGDIIEKWTRKGRKKMFWGCNRYPECDFASWANPLSPEKGASEPQGDSTDNPAEAEFEEKA